MQYECYNDYYNEYDPKRRMMLLDALTPEDGYETEPDHMRALFDCRYSKKRRGNGDPTDNFIGSIMTLRTIVYNSSGLTKRRSAAEVRKAAQALCLERVDEFGAGVLSREMRHVIALYASSCLTDKQYGSVFLGIGRMQDDNILTKTRDDLILIRSLFSEYPEDMAGYRIFRDAIDRVDDELVRSFQPRSKFRL